MDNDNKINTAAQCQCPQWGTYETVDLGDIDDLHENYEIIKERNPWLLLARCKHCNQGWYVAIDTSDYDEFQFVRVTENQIEEILRNDQWPDVLRIAAETLSWLGDETGPELCKSPGCQRKHVKYSALCRLHHYESLAGHLWQP